MLCVVTVVLHRTVIGVGAPDAVARAAEARVVAVAVCARVGVAVRFLEESAVRGRSWRGRPKAMMRSRGTRTNAHSPFAQRQSAVGEDGCGDAPQPVKLAKTARINTAHVMVMSSCVELPGAALVFPAQGTRRTATSESKTRSQSGPVHVRVEPLRTAAAAPEYCVT